MRKLLNYPVKGSLYVLLAMASLSHASINIFVNFGETAIPDAGWNTVTMGNLNVPLSLIDSTGAATSITMEKTAEFRFNNNSGYLGGDVGEFVAAAVSKSLYGDDVAPLQSFVIAGLNPLATYTFQIFGSRDGAVDNRSALYSFSGSNSGSDELNGASNASNFAFVENIQPDLSGEIDFDISKGPSNNSGSGFYYINAMKITEVAVPEPGVVTLIMGLFATGLVLLRNKQRNP